LTDREKGYTVKWWFEAGYITGKRQMGNAMKNIITKALNESLRVKEDFVRKNTSALIHLAEDIAEAFRNDRKLMICGNGGSAVPDRTPSPTGPGAHYR
jgi:hypothetical protein